MPVSAKLFKINSYPQNFPVETAPTGTGQSDDFRLLTKIELIGRGEYKPKELTKLMLTHDKGLKFKGIGYSEENGRIDDLISIADEKEFPAFVFPDKDYLFSAYSSKEIFNQAFKRLSTHYDTFKESDKLVTSRVTIDLHALKEAYNEEESAPEIMGGWFKDLKITNVDVAYLGGGGVEESDYWFKYEQSGKISALRLDFPHPDPDEEPFRILLTQDGSVFSYKNFPENLFLKIVVPIFEYITQFIK